VKAVLCLSSEVIRRLLAEDGPDFDSVRESISRRPDVGFRMLGHQPQQKMLDYYLAADVFVLTSLGDTNPLASALMRKKRGLLGKSGRLNTN